MNEIINDGGFAAYDENQRQLRAESKRRVPAGENSIHRLARLRAIMLDRSEEVTNSIGGVIGYRIALDEDATRRVFEIIDGIGTEPSAGDHPPFSAQKGI